MRTFKVFLLHWFIFFGFFNEFNLRAESRPCHQVKNKAIIKSTSMGKIVFPVFSGTGQPIDAEQLDHLFGQKVYEICFEQRADQKLNFFSIVKFYQDSLAVGKQSFHADLIVNEHGNLIFFFFKQIDRQYLVLRLELDGRQVVESKLTGFDVRQLRLEPFKRIYANLYLTFEKPTP